MYITITTKCNMRCAHCCGDYGPVGKHMSKSVFVKALELASSTNSLIAIGGGEPTLHPRFWEFIGLALGISNSYDIESPVWMATNGSLKKTSLMLAGMAKHGVIGVALSLDDYHDPIDNEVVKAFTKEKDNTRSFSRCAHDDDLREIRDVTGKEVNAGRCNFGAQRCVCPDLIVEVDGTLRPCGCENAPVFGTVFNPRVPYDWYNAGECYFDEYHSTDHN